MLVDTHCHLDFTEKPREWIDNAISDNVLKLICVGTSVEASGKCIEIADSTSLKLRGVNKSEVEIYASVGLHPQEGRADVEKLGLAGSIEKLKKIAQSSKKVVAVGECGLDYHPMTTDLEKEKQRELFKAQIKLAADLNLPLIIHCRNGWEEIFDLIGKFSTSSNNKLRGVFHSWTGDWEAAKKALELGFYISFSGILTFKNAPQVQEVAKEVPLDKVILETDSPFLAPVPYRGEKNEPKNVKITARFLAELRGESPDRIEGATSLNAEKLFKI